MNLCALQYFIKAAELNHFTKASEVLFVSPSTLSKAIASLEREIGVPLFEREGKTVSLTPYGKTFYAFAQRAVEELRAGQEAVKSMYQFNGGQIRLGALNIMCARFLPEILWDFQDQYPDVTLSVQYSLSSRILQDLRKRQIQFGICGEFPAKSPDFASISRQLLFQDELALVVSPRHRLAGRTSVGIEELKNEDFIAFNWNDFGIDLALDRACKAAGFAPKIKTNALNETNILGKAAAGEGIAVISRNTHVIPSHIRMIPFRQGALVHNIYLVWNEEDISRSTAAQRFKEFVLQRAEPGAETAES